VFLPRGSLIHCGFSAADMIIPTHSYYKSIDAQIRFCITNAIQRNLLDIFLRVAPLRIFLSFEGYFVCWSPRYASVVCRHPTAFVLGLVTGFRLFDLEGVSFMIRVCLFSE